MSLTIRILQLISQTYAGTQCSRTSLLRLESEALCSVWRLVVGSAAQFSWDWTLFPPAFAGITALAESDASPGPVD